MKTATNRRLAKKRVQWLNEAFCFLSSFVVADNLVLRNRQLLVAANRYKQPMPDTQLHDQTTNFIYRQPTNPTLCPRAF